MVTLTAVARASGPGLSRGAGLLVYRNFLAYRRAWVFFATGFLEPVLYLFSIGVGVGRLVDGFGFHGEQVTYAAFVAPAMLAASAMNGAVIDSTFGIFFKLRFDHLYDAILATPLRPRDVVAGEATWAVLRGGLYAAGFLLVMLAMGLVRSWWALLALPATLVVGYAFAGAGLALTTWMKSWQDFEYIVLAIIPMFLFSATFFPVTAYDGWLRVAVELTPLYRAVALVRELCTGLVTPDSLWSVAYLLVMGTVGLLVASRRFGALLLR
jgi:lipooligosaccharide transport system permease protein